MIAKTRASLIAKLVLVVALLACASLLATTVAQGAVVAVATPTESLPTYEQQLAASEIAKAVFNVKGRDIHVTLANGKHVIVRYPPHRETQLLEALKAKGITAVNGKGAVVKAPKAHKHKIRYIVGGVVILLIVIVAAILVIRRRRAAAEY
jgi:ABC-type amino acid transport substrate-binding protein